MRNIIRKYGLVLALVAGFGLAGCGGGGASKESAKKPAAAPSKDAVAPAKGGGGKGGGGKGGKGGGPKAGGKTEETVLELKNLKPFVYNPEFKKDAFVIPAPPSGEDVRIGDPFEVDQMLLYGIIRGADMDRAFVRMPNGKDKIVKIGDQLGKHGGKVTEINVDEKGNGYIVVQERYIEPRHPEKELVIEKELPLIKVNK